MRNYRIAQGTLSTLCGDLNRKEVQKEGIHVYVWLIHFPVLQKLTLSKATIFQRKFEKLQLTK